MGDTLSPLYSLKCPPFLEEDGKLFSSTMPGKMVTNFNNSARYNTELMQMRLESGSFSIVCVIIIHLFSNVISLKANLMLFITIYILNSPINPLIFVLAGDNSSESYQNLIQNEFQFCVSAIYNYMQQYCTWQNV